MSHKYSTALSHLVLAGTGIYCVTKCPENLYFARGSYIIIIVNSVLGVWRWGNPDYGHKVESPYQLTMTLQGILALPLIVTQVWLNFGYRIEYDYAHSAVCLFPLALYFGDGEYGDLVDIIIMANAISLGIVAYMHEAYFGIATSISYLINHFSLREGRFDLDDIPVLDVFNYGLCFFCFFAICTLQGNKTV